MSIAHRVGVSLVVLLVLAAAGCGSTATKPTKKAKPEKPIVPAAVDASAAITVDGGRVTVAPPVDWKRQPRSKDYVARYLPGGGNTYPSVTVLGADPPAGITAVDAGNQAEFVKAVADSLAQEYTGAEGKSSLLRKPVAVDLGPHKAVVWDAPGTAKVGGLSQPIERSCAAVVVAGRMYTIEARAPKGKLDDAGRATARGVAAGIALAPTNDPQPAPTPEPDPQPEPAAQPDAAAE